MYGRWRAPLVRTNPRSGIKCLHSPNSFRLDYPIRVDGMGEEESRRLLDKLELHILQPQFRYNRPHEVGDVTLWCAVAAPQSLRPPVCAAARALLRFAPGTPSQLACLPLAVCLRAGTCTPHCTPSRRSSTTSIPSTTRGSSTGSRAKDRPASRCRGTTRRRGCSSMYTLVTHRRTRSSPQRRDDRRSCECHALYSGSLSIPPLSSPVS